jgi:hypothetical protein
MRNMRHWIGTIALAGGAILLALPAAAQLQFTLNPFTQTYAQGDTVTWSATFLNTGSSTITFNGISIASGLPAGLTTDDTLYFTNFDATPLNAGASITANLFTSTADLTVPTATYNSNVTVTYTGGTPSPNDANATFISIITAGGAAVPEPASLALMGIGAAGLAGTLRRRRIK